MAMMAGMRASQSPPAGYTHTGGLTLAGNRRLALGINLASLPWFVVCVIANVALLALVRPRGVEVTINPQQVPSALLMLVGTLLGAIVSVVLALILHEAAHGLVFWVLTRRRPVFGFKGWYLYAAAPGWYFTRPQFLAVGFAPLVLVTLLGLPLLAFAPPLVAGLTVLGLIVNATGAIGDLYIMSRLLRLPRRAVVEDRLDGVGWYLPV
jgi:hypothetical protein